MAKNPGTFTVVWKDNDLMRFCITGPLANEDQVTEQCVDIQKKTKRAISTDFNYGDMSKEDIVARFEGLGFTHNENLYAELKAAIGKPAIRPAKRTSKGYVVKVCYGYPDIYIDGAITERVAGKIEEEAFDTAEQRRAFVERIAKPQHIVVTEDSEYANIKDAKIIPKMD